MTANPTGQGRLKIRVTLRNGNCALRSMNVSGK
jgi:hypothetical protein